MSAKRSHEKPTDEAREAARRALQTSMDTRAVASTADLLSSGPRTVIGVRAACMSGARCCR